MEPDPMNTDLKQSNAPIDQSPKTFDSMSALTWFAEGGRLFLTNPLRWIALGLAWMVLAAALTFIPAVGPALNALLFPFLFGAQLNPARELASGRDLDVLADLRRLSTEPGLRLRLLQVGILPLGYLLLTTALTLTFGYSAITAALMAVLSVLMSMGLVYAVPLILFRHLDSIPVMTATGPYTLPCDGSTRD
jgi:hypothetical protein